jgi:hypothetical protein
MLQSGERACVEAGYLAPVLCGLPFERRGRKLQDLLAPLAQRRQADLDGIDPG